MISSYATKKLENTKLFRTCNLFLISKKYYRISRICLQLLFHKKSKFEDPNQKRKSLKKTNSSLVQETEFAKALNPLLHNESPQKNLRVWRKVL